MFSNTRISKLSRGRKVRKALIKGLCLSLIKYGYITTTPRRAKSAQMIFERLLTRAKVVNLHNIRILNGHLNSHEAVKKLFEIANTKKDVNGGYTRIKKIGFRKGDGSLLCCLSVV